MTSSERSTLLAERYVPIGVVALVVLDIRSVGRGGSGHVIVGISAVPWHSFRAMRTANAVVAFAGADRVAGYADALLAASGSTGGRSPLTR